jgi:hypothetical protein
VSKRCLLEDVDDISSEECNSRRLRQRPQRREPSSSIGGNDSTTKPDSDDGDGNEASSSEFAGFGDEDSGEVSPLAGGAKKHFNSTASRSCMCKIMTNEESDFQIQIVAYQTSTTSVRSRNSATVSTK